MTLANAAQSTLSLCLSSWFSEKKRLRPSSCRKTIWACSHLALENWPSVSRWQPFKMGSDLSSSTLYECVYSYISGFVRTTVYYKPFQWGHLGQSSFLWRTCIWVKGSVHTNEETCFWFMSGCICPGSLNPRFTVCLLVCDIFKNSLFNYLMMMMMCFAVCLTFHEKQKVWTTKALYLTLVLCLNVLCLKWPNAVAWRDSISLCHAKFSCHIVSCDICFLIWTSTFLLLLLYHLKYHSASHFVVYLMLSDICDTSVFFYVNQKTEILCLLCVCDIYFLWY